MSRFVNLLCVGTDVLLFAYFCDRSQALTLADAHAAEGMYRMSVKDRESVCMSVWAAGSPPVDVLPLFRAHAVTP